MFPAIESPDHAVHILFPARSVPAAGPFGSLLDVGRTGDTYAFGVGRAPVEIVVGFRPGIDRVSIAGGAGPLLIVEEDGEAVIIDKAKRRVVLMGVALADVVWGDVVSPASV